MGTDASSNKIHNNINTEYLQTEYTDKSSNQKNTNLSLSFYKNFNIKPINNRNTKNKKKNMLKMDHLNYLCLMIIYKVIQNLILLLKKLIFPYFSL